MVPALIQWPDGPHPASRMPELGYSLERLEAAHPDVTAYQRELAAIGADRHVELRALPAGAPASLVAHIRTPHGLCVLR